MKSQMAVQRKNLLDDITGSIDVDGDSSHLPEPAEHQAHHLHSTLRWTLYFLIVWQYCYSISDNALLILLRFTKASLTCI